MRIMLLAFVIASLATGVQAAEPARLETTIQDHRFSPAELHAPAGVAVIITVHNGDDTAEEFDSTDLKVEKVIAGGRQLPVRIQPLAPGRYSFMGEYHSDTAQGVLLVEDAH